ncbi:BQ5605_C003g02315 [Microbotryum silenes-dioicae]|uniref:BQ5605_C003g02315 protein n=1 Tax=Microbotryum silenes-dioicae TaxID=796604 RepID=A0A2X0M1C3_9BASI|nr:BQ5605_C003g02315 [Microbotryum silenes-dioicae]
MMGKNDPAKLKDQKSPIYTIHMRTVLLLRELMIDGLKLGYGQLRSGGTVERRDLMHNLDRLGVPSSRQQIFWRLEKVEHEESEHKDAQRDRTTDDDEQAPSNVARSRAASRTGLYESACE